MIRPDIRGAKLIAKHLGVSLRTLWRWASEPDPPPMLDCRGTMVANRRDIDAWYARQCTTLTLPRIGSGAPRREIDLTDPLPPVHNGLVPRGAPFQLRGAGQAQLHDAERASLPPSAACIEPDASEQATLASQRCQANKAATGEGGAGHSPNRLRADSSKRRDRSRAGRGRA